MPHRGRVGLRQEKGLCVRGLVCPPSRTSARLSQFRLAMDKVLRQVFDAFLFWPNKVRLVFQIVILLSKFSALQADTACKNFAFYLWQFLFLFLLCSATARCVAFIYLQQKPRAGTASVSKNPKPKTVFHADHMICVAAILQFSTLARLFCFMSLN